MSWVSSKIGPQSHILTGARKHTIASGYAETPQAGWACDNDTLTITSDPLGLVPLYYYEKADTLICADRISDLFKQGVEPKLDPVMLSVNIALMFCPADLTVFEGIKRMPPGSTLTRSAGGGTTIRSYFKLPPGLALTRTAAADRYADMFIEAVRTVSAGHDKLSLPLSGGRDSRHIFLACQKLGKEIEAITFSNFPRGADDDAIAAELCRRAGYRHTVVENSEYHYHASLVRTLPEIDFEVMQHGWIWSVIPELRKNAVPFCDGLAGDTISNNILFDHELNRLLKDGKVDEVAGQIQRELVVRIPSRFRNDANHIERIGALLRTEFSRWLDWPNPHKAYIFFTRSRRGASVPAFALSKLSGVPLLFPYVEARVFDYLMGLQTDIFKSDAYFHDETMQRRYPDYADIPFEQKYAPKYKIGYAASVRNVLPYLRPVRGVPHSLETYAAERRAGIVKVLLGADFVPELWRFVGYDLAEGIDLALAE